MMKTTVISTSGLAAALLVAAGCSATIAQSRDLTAGGVAVTVDIVTDGLEHPWAVDFLPDGTAIVTERPGRIRLVGASGMSKPVEGVPDVWASGQGGLLDIAVAPDFAQSQRIFFTFSEPGDGGAGTALARARLVRDGDTPRLDDVDVIFSMNRKTSRGQHFGSRIVFNPDGTLFVTTGDRGDGNRAQDFGDHAGAVMRIAPDGSIPRDNPFADGGKGLPELWSKGHRNVQGATWDPLTGGLLTVEHGAKGGDEINRPQAGKNYGWPVISYGVNYSGRRIGVGTEAVGYEQPEHYWDPSIAPSGMVSYQGDMFPEWKGDLFVGALKFELLSRLDRDGTGRILKEERYFEGELGRIRDVAVASDGALWLVTDERNGALVRISRAGD